VIMREDGSKVKIVQTPSRLKRKRTSSVHTEAASETSGSGTGGTAKRLRKALPQANIVSSTSADILAETREHDLLEPPMNGQNGRQHEAGTTAEGFSPMRPRRRKIFDMWKFSPALPPGSWTPHVEVLSWANAGYTALQGMRFRHQSTG
jgi:hypothetical protein